MQITEGGVSVERKAIIGIGAILVLFACLSVEAHTVQEAISRKQFLEQAQSARAAEDHAKALALASRAGQMQMTPSVRLFIAEEQTAVGQLAESWANAQLCSAEAQEDPALKNRQLILSACNKLMNQIKLNAGRVTVSMPRPVPSGAQLTIRGQSVSPWHYGQPFFLTPGKVLVEATAPNHLPFRRELSVRAGEEATLSSELVPQNPAPKPATAELRVLSSSPPTGFGRIAPYATMGLGVVGLGASGLFLLARNDALKKLEALCSGATNTVCPETPEARSLQQTASRDNKLTNITLGIGAATLAGGIVWWVLEKPGGADGISSEATIIPVRGGVVVSFSSKFR
jgi:hypothetical protein